jgi:hypothetical protein
MVVELCFRYERAVVGVIAILESFVVVSSP